MVHEDLKSAATGWLGKATFGVDNQSLADELHEANSLVQDAITDMRDASTSNVDAVQCLGDAASIIEDLEGDERWSNNPMYERCIYDGGDGSSYESGFYKSANDIADAEIQTTLDAIRYLKEKAYEESNTLSK